MGNSEAAKAKTYQLKLLCQNTWHGLDHTLPKLMLPAEAPWKRWFRKLATIKGLQHYQFPPLPTADEGKIERLEVFCLQEVNPLNKELASLKEYLLMEGTGMLVNGGFGMGRLSYPIFLEEGLGTLWRGPLQNIEVKNQFLSGAYFKKDLFGGITLKTQFAETRGALLVHGQWGDRRFTFVNLHLHHGILEQSSRHRRAFEVDQLAKLVTPYLETSDAVFLIGDFNCEHNDSALSPIKALGFEEFLPANSEPIYTWDPDNNPQCRKGIRHEHKDIQQFLYQPHQFDHIFYHVRGKAWGKRSDSRAPWKIKVQKIFDSAAHGTWISDHMGIMVDIEWRG